jgi:hypothetical protein
MEASGGPALHPTSRTSPVAAPTSLMLPRPAGPLARVRQCSPAGKCLGSVCGEARALSRADSSAAGGLVEGLLGLARWRWRCPRAAAVVPRLLLCLGVTIEVVAAQRHFAAEHVTACYVTKARCILAAVSCAPTVTPGAGSWPWDGRMLPLGGRTLIWLHLGEAPDAIFLNCFKRFNECDFVRI